VLHATRLSLIAVAAVVAITFVPTASAAAPLASCAANGLLCGTISVPLDYSGATPGQLSLYMEELPAAGAPRGVMLMLAGGPGQASAETFNLATEGKHWQSFFPGYTLVAYDDRGTGKSGPLDCATAATIDQCASDIPNRAFYTTRDHALDIESVRAALGVDKLAVFGVSYGTKHAVAYALAQPSHVERLLLDSALPPDRNPVQTDSLREIPSSIDRICAAGVCPTLPSGLGEKFASLANQYVNSPLLANVTPSTRGTVAVRVDGDEMINLAFTSDLSNGISSELPAAIEAAARGWTMPLARLDALLQIVNSATFSGINVALNLATNCGDGPFPWDPNASLAQKQAAAQAAIDSVPQSALGTFGPWALFDTAPFECVFWPAPSGGAALGPGPLPDVPVLIISGDRDIRTPTAGAVALAAQFPHAQVLVVPGSGHSVLDRSPCAANAVRSWLTGAAPPSTCTRLKLGVPPLARWTRSVATMPPAPGFSGRLGRTVAALLQTLHDAEDAWLLGRQTSSTIDGMAGGTMAPDPLRKLTLENYSAASGIALSGTILLQLETGTGQPLVPLAAASGTLTVSGSAVLHGKLRAAGNRLTGRLGGKRVVIIF
jgi:pimeloyl-ACP methyl ester carboxylesterase